MFRPHLFFCLLERYEKGYRSSIIPPGAKEIFFREVWNMMKRLLEEADEIVFHLMITIYIKNELNGIKFKKDLKITIINPENRRLRNIYAEVFCTNNLEMKFKTFSEYCQMLIEQK
jgi:hypothetical protein